MCKSLKYPTQYDMCDCGNHKTIRSNLCHKCSVYQRTKFETVKDVMHSARHGQSTKFNIIRGRARTQYKHIKVCEHCGYSKHVEVCHIKPISSFSDDSLVSEVNDRSNIKILCPNCHWEFDHPRKKEKIKIRKQRPRKVNWPTKDELQKLLWEKPTTQIANDYGVTDNAVAKWAKKYGLNKPPRGYWSKK